MTTSTPPLTQAGGDTAAIERIRQAVHGESDDPIARADAGLLLSAYDRDHLRAISAEIRAWGYGRILEEIDEHCHGPEHVRAFLAANGWKRAYGAGSRAEIWAKGGVTVCVPRSFAFHESADLTARLVIGVAHADRTTPQQVLDAIAARSRG
jgi:hypothetical protein